jgi:hypothetical protein
MQTTPPTPQPELTAPEALTERLVWSTPRLMRLNSVDGTEKNPWVVETATYYGNPFGPS